MDKIKIAITGRVASVVALPEVVADNAEYEVEFAVDERDRWNPAVPMTALFVRRDAKYTAVVMDAGETSCTMPPQTGTNVVYIGLTQEEMRTTTPARIKIRRSVRAMTDFPPLPDKDVYAQILANFAGLRMLSGKGAPTAETEGKVNQLYRDETNNRLYVCVDDASGYTWAMISGSSGGGAVVTIDTTLSKSGQAADAKAAGDAIREKLDATALPTAVNDALAQAKASGEFDGAKGDKGDTGPAGPQGETGPAGPKGADGKDGAGMDVTGAKVGQIAKITAVDSAGKPTGWEPVDMPSGGGETWELINEITLTETVNDLLINKDANGNAFSLRKAKVECIIQMDESDPFTYIKLRANGLSFTNNTTTRITKGTVYYSVLIDCMGPAGIMGRTTGINNFNYNWTYTIQKNGYKYNADWRQTSITSITVSPNEGSKPLGIAGTKVVVYGVRK